MSEERLEELLHALPAPPARWVEAAVEIPRFADPIEDLASEDPEEDLDQDAELSQPGWSNLEQADLPSDDVGDDYSADHPPEDSLA